MNNNQNEKKEKGKVSALVKKASDISKKMANDVKNSAIAMSEKKKISDYEKRMKKYNPLFPEQYNSNDFNIPNMIVIVDDAVRRDIDVCDGAIGWRDNSSGMEILYLYDEWVQNSGIDFVPCAMCDSSYYVDNFNRKRYVRVDCIFAKAHEEKMAELEHIAYSLGAKSCSIEIIEMISESLSSKQNRNGKIGGHTEISYGNSVNDSTRNLRNGKVITYFEGNNIPQRPHLKWYAHDENILGLIDMRCKNNNTIKCKVMELSGTFSATMSQKVACTIDATLKKIGGSGNYNMEKQANRENSSKLIYEIDFS
ncbi:MAG: hypothetical protein IJW19_03145 [Clostridia bacterium]|nr:hypothetical protein [Clostridia bacterium]